jgi:GTP-binding protein
VEIKTVTFRCAALKAAHRPQEWFPQVAVAGRSNVGKSSLLNWLFRRNLAKVAKAPGKTRTLNFFLVNRSFYMVDLPGYGYAKVDATLRQQWGRELGAYLTDESRVAGVISLIDIRRGVTPLDRDLHQLVLDAGRERVVVLTKADKVARGKRSSMQRQVQKQLALPTLPIVTSVHSGEGRRELVQQVERFVSEWRDRQGGE